MSQEPTATANTKPFHLGDRVTDPSLANGAFADDRYKINGSVDMADARLLKFINVERGTLQLVTANLIHQFCNELRELEITNYTDIDRFHIWLAYRSGGTVAPDVLAKVCSRLDTPGGDVCGGAVARPNRQEHRDDERLGVAGARGDAPTVAQVTSDPSGQTPQGRGEPGLSMRRGPGEEDSTRGEQDVRGKAGGKAKRAGARGEAGK